ncbi:ArsR/SmtB family transcription factor [Cellulomonas fengjieae]|uniref:Winged helix-turn-helix transcriptional regulator n=1 Tax=Cellulomonas fengjieae TaxID=2819978 RepID=A0ABS3SEM0_9CELL|nr:metalloregulator ArsR/SmtB family transcription factor [Cellulomonas fengjieae]MBO3084187.1 winged helix-turn-helix transcriptional regulator [Cellulomonas fengjieae]MBO3103593.1 winged helix-turn-helix transcriptional regulator [Cellulomonas fengjieae]QVI64568.1 winged helix-turn-helix transcriptional regulator [Cellulomonas fengjieae]
MSETETDTVLRALAEPRRRDILTALARDEVPVGRLAEEFDVTRSAVSQHLRVLEDAGLVTRRTEGTRNFYRSRPEGLAGLRAYLDRTWAASLDTARRLVEADAGVVDANGQEGSDRATA